MRFFTSLLRAGSALALLSASAAASDLPSRKTPPFFFDPLPFAWTGFYLGVHAGSLRTSGQYTDSNANLGWYGSTKGAVSSYLGGAQGGYNQQFGSLVVGLEADVDATDVGQVFSLDGGPSVVYGYQNALNSKLQAALRARAGYAFDRALLYVSAGAAAADVRRHYAYNDGSSLNVYNASSWAKGWTLGAGFNYAVTDVWSFGVDYRFTKYNATHDIGPASGGSWEDYHDDTKLQTNAIRLGVNYRFGS